LSLFGEIAETLAAMFPAQPRRTAAQFQAKWNTIQSELRVYFAKTKQSGASALVVPACLKGSEEFIDTYFSKKPNVALNSSFQTTPLASTVAAALKSDAAASSSNSAANSSSSSSSSSPSPNRVHRIVLEEEQEEAQIHGRKRSERAEADREAAGGKRQRMTRAKQLDHLLSAMASPVSINLPSPSPSPPPSLIPEPELEKARDRVFKFATECPEQA